MTGWTLPEMAAVVGGRVFGASGTTVTAVSTDSRSLEPGAAFFALKGERFDGHDHCADALAAGAAVIIVEGGRTDLEPRIEVAGTEAALLALAVDRRDALSLPVIAITGSTGKTSTKDLTACAMGPQAWASPASYNNEIGVPLTVLATPPGADALVVEVGSRGVGHIAALSPAIRPDVAVITNLGLVHLEMFGTTERLVAAKSELLDALGRDGVAVLPAGEARLGFEGTVIRFGERGDADVTVSQVELDESGCPSFVFRGFGQESKVQLAMAGAHQALNAAAAVAAAVAAGRDLQAALDGVARASGSPWRMEVHRGRFTVVNDSYNANPTSMEAALRTTAELSGHRIAVLGLMAELGEVSEEEHQRIGKLAADLGFDPVIVVGEAPGLVAGAAGVAVAVPDREAATAAALAAVADGCSVVVKGSRVAGLEMVAAALIEEAAA